MKNQLYKNKEWLIEQYKTKSTLEIAKEVGISKQSLLKWFKKHNIKRRQGSEAKCKGIYNYNVNYFKQINTKEKAYWLGFIMADGCITRNKYGYTFQMNLARKDAEHLERFAKTINYSNQISDVINDTGFGDGKKFIKKYMKITNNEFCLNLMNLGIVLNKTGKEHIPNIDRKYYQDFIRGIFDGDGCMTWHYRSDKPNTLSAKSNIVCSNRGFLEDIAIILNEEANIPVEKIHIYKSRKIWSLEICSLGNIKKLYEYLYTKRCIRLQRKMNNFNEPLKYYNNKQKI